MVLEVDARSEACGKNVNDRELMLEWSWHTCLVCFSSIVSFSMAACTLLYIYSACAQPK